MSTQSNTARKVQEKMSFNTLLIEEKGNVGIITFNRPNAQNALSNELTQELGIALEQNENNPHIRVTIITGGEKVFAAGADIKEMADKNYPQAYQEDFITKTWEKISQCRKPIIAAVSGYALGGGCEIAMMCDFIIASDSAKFGQPEVTIGTMPGAGGTQRLTRVIGKAKAMEMCLTGRVIDAQEAERSGLVSRVVPQAKFAEEVLNVAQKIATFSQPSVFMIKESVNRAYETTLSEGIRFERRLFQSTFATNDQKEGMAAFVAKRQPNFKDN